ncbi:MAG: chemotaxis protein CheA, partial [Alcaligenaceae bacterium]|nr:chemotaxis protein CheA [Alcaligenaceae bacterium]
MSSGVDLSQFYDTFFDEADELLAEMESLLLELDVDDPDSDMLNAIFRAAHSIKGGAATFGCFGHLADTTHLLENLLDFVRDGEMALRQDLIDLFLETKDILSDQVAAYRNGEDPDEDTYQRISGRLRQIAKDHAEGHVTKAAAPTQSKPEPKPEPVVTKAADGKKPLRLTVSNASDKDLSVLRDEMALMGTILYEEKGEASLTLWLDTTASADDIEAVCCFVVNEDQLSIAYEPVPTAEAPAETAEPVADAAETETPAAETKTKTAEAAEPSAQDTLPKKEAAKTDAKPAAKKAVRTASSSRGESSTLRVGVEKVDQIINLVGELVITQAMLVQTASTLDPVLHDRLLNGIEQLERNARDLQEAVMSIRMMPMEYVFSRFPRVVRENAARMEKEIRLVTKGAGTELDKSLIERIIDPLTHLVRNSIDHGIEIPDQR